MHQSASSKTAQCRLSKCILCIMVTPTMGSEKQSMRGSNCIKHQMMQSTDLNDEYTQQNAQYVLMQIAFECRK